MFSANEGDAATSFFGSGIYTDKLDRSFIELGSVEKDLSDTESQLLNNLVAISKETVADGTTVLPYMAFDKVVISGK